MELKDKKCVPCTSYIPPISQLEKNQFINDLKNEWILTHEDSRIERIFKFKNFKMALEFTNQVGGIAETEKHHPEIHLSWGQCRVEIWTHTNNNLLENDFILAAKISEIFSNHYQKS
jgi:4a-hydroxytetrahydrobiopterin dehydratase